MALSFSKKTYSDTASRGNGITASDMNRIETAISNLTSEVNAINKRFHVDGDNNITFSKCICFSMNNIGVFDSKTNTGCDVK